MWEMAKNCGKWVKYLTNGIINWELTQRFGKRLKYWEMVQTNGARFKCLRDCISMLQMT